MKKIHKRLLASLLAAVMLAGQTAVFAAAVPDPALETGKDVNLALQEGVTATADDTDGNEFVAAKTIDGDHSANSRWGSHNDGKGTTPRILTLDLGKTCTINRVKLFWEKENILEYFIETSTDNSTWNEQLHITAETGKSEEEHTFTAPVDAQYIRVRVTKYGPAVDSWYNVGVREFEVYGQKKEEIVIGNLARLPGVQAEASNTDGNQFTADKTIDGNTSNDSRWGSNNDSAGTTERTLTLNLGESRTIDHIKVYWEKANILEYYVETSTDNSTWKEQKHITAEAGTLEEEHKFDVPVDAQYIRLRVTHYGLSATNWYNVGVREFEVYGHMPENVQPPKPDDTLIVKPAGTNLARLDSVTASATNVESNTNFNADKARDGNKTAKESRWATDRDVPTPTITYNLGGKYNVGSVILYWESNNADEWYVETSLDGNTWEPQKSFNSKLPMGTAPIQTVNFDHPVEARYVRVRVAKYSSSYWNNIAMYEFEVYQEKSEIVMTPATVANELAQSVTIENGKVVMSGEVPEKYDATFGCNYEQVVGADGTVHTPLVDTKVEITVTVREKEDSTKCGSAKAELTIPGVHHANEGNEKPAIVPELAQWYSSAAQAGKVFTLNEQSRIIADDSMQSVAKELKNDILDLFGLDLPIVSAGVKAGDIQLTKFDGEGFDKETYNMIVTDHVEIQANHTTGAYWGTRSVLQALVLSQNQTIAQGTARDYPEFKSRGFLLDVGRKPMSMDKLRDFVKNMAWYKMNDFHVHLSDNLIFMEDYVRAGKEKEAWNAYQGFRLESSKKGLTSKDYFYTKDEFKSFIKDSRDLGVNITPELDVPAHTLSLSNYIKNTLNRPDLVLNKKGGDRPWFDHVDISKQEAIDIVKTVFDEYIDEGVFDEETVIHIGADEFYDSHPAYRNFLIQMIDYIQNTKHRQVRVWGSLKKMSSHPEQHPFTSENVHGAQANIWSLDWADPAQMFNLGFDIINTLDRDMYMVPNGSNSIGAYHDFLAVPSLYNNWEPENIGGTWIPTGSEQMLGASFAIWQDNIDTHASGVNETDTFYRFMDAMPYLSVKMWGTGGDGLDRNFEAEKANIQALGTAPNTNPYHEIEKAADTKEYAQYSFNNNHDLSGNKHDLKLNNAAVQDGSLVLNGGKSYAETGLNVMGPNSSLSFKAYKDSTAQDSEQILFEADAAYGEATVKALSSNNGKWKLGFARELYEYVFNYDLPCDQWVELTIRNEGSKTYLLVDGKKIEAVGSFLPDEHATTQFMGKTGIKHSSFDIPVARIGSTEHAFQGKIDSVVFHSNDVTPAERFEVQFVSNDGTVLDSVTVTAGQAITEPEAPVLDGFVFKGWFTDKDCTTAYDFTTPVAGDTILYAKWVAVDKSALKEQIRKAEDMISKKDQYVAGNWQQLVDALDAANKVMENKAATDTEVQAAVETLSNAMSAQLLKADKAALKDLVKKAESKKLKGYTEESVKAFHTALEEAKAVLNNETLSQKDQSTVDKAVAQLNAAIAGLTAEKAPDSPPKDNTTPPQNNGNHAQNSQGNSAATGDDNHMLVWSIALLISLAGATWAGAAAYKRNKK